MTFTMNEALDSLGAKFCGFSAPCQAARPSSLVSDGIGGTPAAVTDGGGGARHAERKYPPVRVGLEPIISGRRADRVVPYPTASAFPAVAASRPHSGCCRLRASAGTQGAADDCQLGCGDADRRLRRCPI